MVKAACVQKNWEEIRWGLGMGWLPHPPAYGTVWRILNLLEISKLEKALSQWAKGANVEAICIDEKSLRGSKREGGLPALQVVVALGQGIKLVLGREGVDEERATEAALHLLKGIPKELSWWVRGHWEIENSGFWVLDVRIMLVRLVVLFMPLGVRR